MSKPKPESLFIVTGGDNVRKSKIWSKYAQMKEREMIESIRGWYHCITKSGMLVVGENEDEARGKGKPQTFNWKSRRGDENREKYNELINIIINNTTEVKI